MILPNMSRRHFAAIAAAMRKSRPPLQGDGGKDAWLQWRNCVVALANMCAGTNRAFDRALFYENCGMGE